MAVRDREWPGYTIWYCCQDCGRLWTYQGTDVVALELSSSLGPAGVGEGVPARMCAICEGRCDGPAAEISGSDWHASPRNEPRSWRIRECPGDRDQALR